MRNIFLIIFLLSLQVYSQTDLHNYCVEIQKDPLLANASLSLCVLDGKEGTVLYGYHENTSLSPASTMKTITTASALQILGKDFHFDTYLQYTGKLDKATGILEGDLIIKGGGDPTLNSEYFRKPADSFNVVNRWATILKEKGIKKIAGRIVPDISLLEEEVPGTWVWGDLGNYFGAAPCGLNYNDNKIYLVFKPVFKNGDSILLSGTVPYVNNIKVINHLKAGGVEDNSLIYRSPESNELKVYGTLPVSAKTQAIEASLPAPYILLVKHFQQALTLQGIELANSDHVVIQTAGKKKDEPQRTTLYVHRSPSLEKIIFFTNMHSNNLYAESIFRAIAIKKGGWGSNWQAIQAVMLHLKSKGLSTDGLFINDGSGLSRSNGVNGKLMAEILYMMKRDSIVGAAFYNSLPVAGESGSLRSLGKGTPLEKNFHAKSGYITRVRAYSGYLKSAGGKELCVSLIVNNYNGGPHQVKKMIEEMLVKVYESF